jgi:hypothetical protein
VISKSLKICLEDDDKRETAPAFTGAVEVLFGVNVIADVLTARALAACARPHTPS